MNRLQPVSHVGERAADDHAHRVIEEARAHLVLPARAARSARDRERRCLLQTSDTFFATNAGGCVVSSGVIGSNIQEPDVLGVLLDELRAAARPGRPSASRRGWSAAEASSTSTRTSRRRSGSIVVSQSCSGFISPRPLKRESWIAFLRQLQSFASKCVEGFRAACLARPARARTAAGRRLGEPRVGAAGVAVGLREEQLPRYGQALSRARLLLGHFDLVTLRVGRLDLDLVAVRRPPP